MSKCHSHPKFKRLKSTLMGAFLFVSLVPMLLIAFFFLQSHIEDLEEQSTTYLTSMRDGTTNKVTAYIKSLDSEVIGFVHSELAYASGGRFYGLIDSFRRLGPSLEQSRHIGQQKYVLGSGDQVNTQTKKGTLTHQSVNRYRLLHTRYHSTYKSLLERSDFDDIALVDLEGNVAYSVQKNRYYSTNLETGPYRDSELGLLFKRLKQHVKSQKDTLDEYNEIVLMSGFSKGLDRSDDKEFAWFAAPIIQQEYLHSYAFFRLPLSALTNLIDVDSDYHPSISLIDQSNKLLVQTLDKEVDKSLSVASKALQGIEQVETYTNAANQNMIAAYAPIKVHNLKWAVIVETPEKVAFDRVNKLYSLFLIIICSAVIVIVIGSHYLANFITRPLLKLTWAAERISAGDLIETVEGTGRKDEIGRLAVSFERMQRSIREKIELINQQNTELAYNLNTIATQNKELQQADKLKDEFLATTSHELRTPLHGMIGVAQAIIGEAHGSIPSSQRYQLEIIINSGHRLSNLVDDLLDYHKMQYGQLKLQAVAVSLSSASRLVIELSKHLIDKKPVRIINQIDDSLPMISADSQRLEQVLYNLVGNAMKFTPEGKIILTAEQDGEQLKIQIIDTGSGIPEDDLEHIFEPLIQGNSSNYQQGTGLGLSISKQLISIMQGELSVTSQPMLGTTFTLRLPLASAQQLQEFNSESDTTHYTRQTLSFAEDTPIQPHNPDGKLVMIADDEPVNLNILESFLRVAGYRVISANNGRQVIDLIAQDKPDILLLDIMMPELSGFEVCKHLRELYTHNELPIIMLTALSQSEDKIKGFECGANDYLVKPFNKQELSARIQVHLNASLSEQRKLENDYLNTQLSQREKVESLLLDTQSKLLEQLESTPEAIICINEAHKITFANKSAMELFKRSNEQMKRSQIEEFIAPKYLQFDQPHRSIDIDLFVAETKQVIASDIFTLPLETGLKGMIIFNPDLDDATQRVNNLEVALDALASYAFAGDKSQLQQLKGLGEEFAGLVEMIDSDKENKQQNMRQLLVDCMSEALEYWESHQGNTKFGFAEQSGLWRVYLDRSTLQTRTLDKYLRVETLPKTPRWRTVLNSLDYILTHSNNDNAQRAQLLELREQLQTIVS
ncbi:hybrid sensor histidine kinase/response regulator [Vibrio sp. UCD-FRSSP16_10]|uniref:response regulator n=1 Tax=unclassified Vibrio TaxID=2614977 RepID=UPI00080214C3|nr:MULTISPECIES: response regulator [unclassified Vibrio]OBT17266.1 hybrid sensor histidine kinase/response regulator [Vibrio sp. UCD-FRSSP16_30]OBT23035.1 hybrid sensor histidine kinase/response regulator [Vibrio sp. UCD-FRSSP16_10]